VVVFIAEFYCNKLGLNNEVTVFEFKLYYYSQFNMITMCNTNFNPKDKPFSKQNTESCQTCLTFHLSPLLT